MRQINLYNKLFYDCCEQAFFDSDLANFFISVEPIQIALKEKIERLVAGKEIKLLELASGANPRRWEIISNESTNKIWKITLSDFSKNSLPDISNLKSKNYFFREQIFDLFKTFPKLSMGERYDVILITYGFDSLWFDKDIHLEKKDGRWYQTIYNLKINNAKLKNDISSYLKYGKCAGKITLNEIERIIINKKNEFININSLPNGSEISKRYFGAVNIGVNYPGGLIQIVDEAFSSILKKGGTFIIGDIAVTDQEGYITSYNRNYPDIFMDDFRTVGKVAKCKIEDYGLAQSILEKQGFNVELKNIMDFVEEADQITPINVTDHFIMSIKNS